jgi:hypothetical protein
MVKYIDRVRYSMVQYGTVQRKLFNRILTTWGELHTSNTIMFFGDAETCSFSSCDPTYIDLCLFYYGYIYIYTYRERERERERESPFYLTYSYFTFNFNVMYN